MTDTYDRGTVEWRAVLVTDNGVPVTAPLEVACTVDAPTDTDWRPADERGGQPGIVLDTRHMEPGTHTIRARWTDGDDRPQIVVGQVRVA